MPKPKQELSIEDAKTRLSAARSILVISHPFFAQLVMRLRPFFSNQVPTAGTDGVYMAINPGFAASLTSKELQFVLVHEIMHCVLLHHIRRGERNPQKWNMAADHAINLMLVDMGFELPQKHAEHLCCDPQYAKMTAETIYDKMPDPPEQPPVMTGFVTDKGQLGKDPNAPQDGNEEGEGIGSKNEGSEEDWRAWAVAAAENARQRGKFPAGLEGFIQDLVKPKVNWRDLLARFLVKCNDDFSWTRPNRRYIHQGVYLPSKYDETLGDIVIAIDNSGSVSNKELQQFLSEMNAILNGLKPTSLIAMQVDADVQTYDTYLREELPVKMNLRVKGRGGTDFRPPFRRLEQEGIKPECFVYLTDMEGPFPEDPGYPTLWLSVNYDADPAPIGQTAYFPRKQGE